MSRKLIFLQKGIGVYCLDKCPIHIDTCIQIYGYKKAIKEIIKTKCEWYVTTCPTVLNTTDEKGNPLWWNEERQAWDIYFITYDGKDTLIPIQDFTDKQLRKTHNIEKLYLNGGLND